MKIVIAIMSVIAGYFFMRNFGRIDKYLFGRNDEDYESFGLITVMLCCFAGAAVAGILFLELTYNVNCGAEFIIPGSGFLAISSFAFVIYTAVDRMKTAGLVIRKILFMWMACIIGVALGAAGSVVMLVVLILVTVFYALMAMLKGTSVYGNDSHDSNASVGSGDSHDCAAADKRDN